MPSRRESGRSDSRRYDNRALGLGVELAGALVGFTLVGVWIDHSFGTSPKGVLICVGLGLVGGLYNFLRSSLHILRSPAATGPSRAPEARRPSGPGKNTSGDDSPGDKQPQVHRRDPADVD